MKYKWKTEGDEQGYEITNGYNWKWTLDKLYKTALSASAKGYKENMENVLNK